MKLKRKGNMMSGETLTACGNCGGRGFRESEESGARCTECGGDGRAECIEHGEDCAGPVEHRSTPDRRDGKAFPRCEKHFEDRLEESERIMELESDVPPDWFDPGYAGERWAEDD